MTKATLLFKNLGRNKLRTALTLAAIALPMFVFTLASSLQEIVARALADSDRNLRVAVHQKLTFTAYLPQRIREEILSFAPDGYITAICRTSWFGGRVEGSQTPFPNMAVDRDTFPLVYSEFGLTPEEIERFQNEKRGAVVAKQLADQMNWSLGDRVTLKGQLPPYLTLEFVIVAIPTEIPGPWLYFALDYYDDAYREATGAAVGINNFWLKCTTPQAREWALTRIDEHFANSENETRTEMESTFLSAFLRSGGDWVGMVWNIGQLVVLVAVAVAFNTLSMAFRERTREIAVLRALGFSAGRIVRMVLAEGVLYGLLGGLIAAGPVYLLTNLFPIRLPGFNRPIQIQDDTALLALGVALACGLLAALVPATLAGRLRVATALRKVA